MDINSPTANPLIQQAGKLFIENLMVLAYRTEILKDGAEPKTEIRKMIDAQMFKKDGPLAPIINDFAKEYVKDDNILQRTENAGKILKKELSDYLLYIYGTFVNKINNKDISLQAKLVMIKELLRPDANIQTVIKNGESLIKIYSERLERLNRDEPLSLSNSGSKEPDINEIIKHRAVVALNTIQTAAKVLEKDDKLLLQDKDKKNTVLLKTMAKAVTQEIVIQTFWETIGQISASIMPIDFKGFIEGVLTTSGKEIAYMQGGFSRLDNTFLLRIMGIVLNDTLVHILMQHQNPIEAFKKYFVETSTKMSVSEIRNVLKRNFSEKIGEYYRAIKTNDALSGIEIREVLRQIKQDNNLNSFFNKAERLILEKITNNKKMKEEIIKNIKNYIKANFHLKGTSIEDSVFIDFENGIIMVAGVNEEGNLISSVCYNFWELALVDPLKIFDQINKKVHSRLQKAEGREI